MRIAIISGSTRPGRKSDRVAAWVHSSADVRPGVEFEVVRIADLGLPLLDEPVPARAGIYEREHTRRWSHVAASYDGFVIVTPEYNHSVPAALKNAIDFLYDEWSNKAVGFVGYGADGGVRAVEHLRQIMAEVRSAGVGTSVALALSDDFADYRDPDADFTPRPHQDQILSSLLDEVIDWAKVLRGLRDTRSA